jgi:UV DNA damage endonuclease
MSNIRWGLCCQFLDAPIRFRTATHRYVMSLGDAQRRAYLSDVVGSNAIALAHAVERCHELGIGAFRVNSQVAPLATHPVSGYALDDLDPADAIRRAWAAAGALARERGVRLSFHPDQFVVLNSEREEVVASSVRELEHQAALAELIGADVLCLHVGGVTGGVEAAVARFERGLERVSGRVRERLAIENDDRLFSPREIFRLHERTGLPFIYDVHHHRCHPDGLTATEATAMMVESWKGREPYAHLSSPRDGWTAPNPRPHAAYVDPADVPDAWLAIPRLTVDVEAKDKERAVVEVMRSVDAAHAATSGTAGTSGTRTPAGAVAAVV